MFIKTILIKTIPDIIWLNLAIGNAHSVDIYKIFELLKDSSVPKIASRQKQVFPVPAFPLSSMTVEI